MSPVRFRLQEILDEIGMSQSELARKSGVAYTTVSRMCRNISTQISLATLDTISEVVGRQPGDLIERVAEKKRR